MPYFYSQCLQPARKNARGMAFKSKQFTLYVVVPAAQWVEYEAFMEKEDSATITSKDTSDDGETSSAHVPSTVASTTTGDAMNVVNRPFHLCLAQTTFMPARISAQVATSAREYLLSRALRIVKLLTRAPVGCRNNHETDAFDSSFKHPWPASVFRLPSLLKLNVENETVRCESCSRS